MTRECCISQVLGWKLREIPTDTEPERRDGGSHSHSRSSGMLHMSLLGLEHSMTKACDRAAGPSLGMSQTHTRGQL